MKPKIIIVDPNDNIIGYKERENLASDNIYHHFTQWYILQIDKNIADFTIQRDEVQEIKWFSQTELLDQIKSNPSEFLPTMKIYFDLFNYPSLTVSDTSC